MATRYEYYNTGDDAEAQVMWGAPYWGAQTFTPLIAHTITSVKLKLQRHGTPGNLTVSIRATIEESPWIVTPDLITGTTDGNTLTDEEGGEWREIFLGDGVGLLADTKYAICARCYGANVSNHVGWRGDSGDGAYPRGRAMMSTNGGSTWSVSALSGWDLMFEEWGVPAVSAPTVTTDPATSIRQTTATLNGTLDDDGGEACDCGFEWGETIAYGNTTPTQSRTTGQDFAQTITGLRPGVTYHFRAFATNGAGTGNGTDRTFQPKMTGLNPAWEVLGY